jgi:hypothetical protein
MRLEDFRRSNSRRNSVPKDRRHKPTGNPVVKRKSIPSDQMSFFTTVRLSYSEIGIKQLSELALFSVGQFLWEKTSLSLEDYMRMEFLLNKLQGNSLSIAHIKDKRRQDLTVLLSLVLKHGQRIDNYSEFIPVERLFNIMFSKIGSMDSLSERAHLSRADIWATRYYLWIELRSESEESNSIRGKRYSSYTKGYHDGSTLRPSRAENFQVLDREEYSRTLPVFPNLEIWDPEEFRRNL